MNPNHERKLLIEKAPMVLVVHYQSDYVPNPNPNGETPAEYFYAVRGCVLAASQTHGETGPESRSDTPRYWLVEDQYNDELYQIMQVYEPEGWTIEWLTSLMDALRKHERWGVSISNIDQGQLLVFADRVMVTGPTFARCHDLASVVSAARIASEQFDERQNGPLRRQLEYLKRLFPAAMKEARASTYSYLATFDGYQVHEGNAVWVLQTKNDDELRLDTEYAPIRASAVTSDGVIHPQFCRDFWPYTESSPPFWLMAYIVENRTQTKFRLIDGNDKPVGAITIDKVTTDSELNSVQ